MDKILEVTLLYDFYGELLGEKQRDIFEMHYQNDLSLAEIGEFWASARQAVFDQLKTRGKGAFRIRGKAGPGGEIPRREGKASGA